MSELPGVEGRGFNNRLPDMEGRGVNNRLPDMEGRGFNNRLPGMEGRGVNNRLPGMEGRGGLPYVKARVQGKALLFAHVHGSSLLGSVFPGIEPGLELPV